MQCRLTSLTAITKRLAIRLSRSLGTARDRMASSQGREASTTTKKNQTSTRLSGSVWRTLATTASSCSKGLRSSRPLCRYSSALVQNTGSMVLQSSCRIRTIYEASLRSTECAVSCRCLLPMPIRTAPESRISGSSMIWWCRRSRGLWLAVHRRVSG